MACINMDFHSHLETYSLDWASSRANQQQLKVFLGVITTVLRQGELTKATTSEQLLSCSVACSLYRMCTAAGFRTTISKDCILILNCIFETLNRGFVSLDSNFSTAFETNAFHEILHRGSFHVLAKSDVDSCQHSCFFVVQHHLQFVELLRSTFAHGAEVPVSPYYFSC